MIPLDMKDETYGNAGFCPAPHSTFSEKEYTVSIFCSCGTPHLPEDLENYTLKKQILNNLCGDGASGLTLIT